MSKRTLATLASIPIAFVAFWASGAYISYEPNPMNWLELGRFLHLFATAATPIMVATYPGWNDEQKR